MSYLDAMNLLCSADAILALGTTEHDYAASKLFSCLLAKRPLLGVFHEETGPAAIMKEISPSTLVVYSDERLAMSHAEEIASTIQRLADAAAPEIELVDISRFDAYSARATTKQLVAVFEEAIGPVESP